MIQEITTIPNYWSGISRFDLKKEANNSNGFDYNITLHYKSFWKFRKTIKFDSKENADKFAIELSTYLRDESLTNLEDIINGSTLTNIIK